MILFSREHIKPLLKRGWFLAILVFVFCLVENLEGARNGYDNNEIWDSIESLRHQVANHEAEIRVFDEKFKSQEDIVDSLSNQFKDSVKSVKNSASSNNQDVNLQLADCKKRIANLERTLEQQSKNLDDMQKALTSLIEAIQGKEPVAAAPSNGKIYRVKSGDSLEKIAKQNHTTIKKLKELNNLTSDQIIIGQKIELPDES